MHTIGVLGLQGDYEKHCAVLHALGVNAKIVVDPDAVGRIDALVIPGGESTTMGKLMVSFRLLEPIRSRIAAGMPVFGTCAGMILLADRISGSDQPRLGTMHIEVARNAYGRQIDSFEADIGTSVTPTPVRGVFIRAPIIERVGDGVSILAEFEEHPVLVRQDGMLAASFHPELTEDTRIHAYFLSMLDR